MNAVKIKDRGGELTFREKMWASYLMSRPPPFGLSTDDLKRVEKAKRAFFLLKEGRLITEEK